MTQDIIIAALAALVITWIIIVFSRIARVILTRSTELGYSPADIEAVLKRCYSMFPVESLIFNGITFYRGMAVRVITNRKRIIEGKFLGTNDDNMVCFLTPDTIIAHELNNIEEIIELGEGD